MALTGKLYRSVENLAREHTETAIQVLADVMTDTLSEPRDRISAANSLLDRGHGKPTNVTVTLPPTRREREQAFGMTNEELMAVIEAEPLPALAVPEEEACLDIVATEALNADLSDPDSDTDPLCQ